MSTTGSVLTFLNLGSPTGLKFSLEHGRSRALFEMGLEHAPGVAPFSLGLRPRPGRELSDLMAVGMAPRDSGVLDEWDRRSSLFLTHLHLDHVALVRWVHPDVPLYYPAAMEPVRAACVRSGHLSWRTPAGIAVPDRGRVAAGEIEVEFVAVDHDVPGATGFLVRTPDLTLAYTGDHRWHGLRPELTAAFAEAAQGVDVLVQETVSLGWAPTEEELTGQENPAGVDLREQEVIDGFGTVLDGARELVVTNLYPMNRERVHAFGAACSARGRRLLLDPESAAVAGWPLAFTHEDLDAVRRAPRSHCLQVDFSSLPLLIDLQAPPGSLYVHSNGLPLGPYDPAFAVLRSWLTALGLEYVSLSSSGHSRPADLVRMVEIVRPRVALPVHSRRPEALRVPGVPTLVAQSHRPYTPRDLLASSV